MLALLVSRGRTRHIYCRGSCLPILADKRGGVYDIRERFFSFLLISGRGVLKRGQRTNKSGYQAEDHLCR